MIFFTNLILDEGAPGFGDAKRQGRIGRRRADEVKRYRLPPPQIVRTIRGCPCTNDSSLKNRSYNGGFRAKWLRACVVRTICACSFVRTTTWCHRANDFHPRFRSYNEGRALRERFPTRAKTRGRATDPGQRGRKSLKNILLPFKKCSKLSNCVCDGRRHRQGGGAERKYLAIP